MSAGSEVMIIMRGRRDGDEKGYKLWSVIILGSSFTRHWIILISDFSFQLKEMMKMKRLKPLISERATNDDFKKGIKTMQLRWWFFLSILH